MRGRGTSGWAAQAVLKRCITQIYELRSILEALAAKNCALQASPADIARMRTALEAVQAGYAVANSAAVLAATTQFYETMFTAAGRNVAWNVVTSLNGRITHLRATTIATPGRSKDGVAEMKAILDAIEIRDGTAAEMASTAHVRNALQLALTQAQKRG